MNRALLVLLLAGLLGEGALAQEPTTPPPLLTHTEPSESPPPMTPTLSEEDQEIVDNLELLENLENAEDFELLMELSAE